MDVIFPTAFGAIVIAGGLFCLDGYCSRRWAEVIGCGVLALIVGSPICAAALAGYCSVTYAVIAYSAVTAIFLLWVITGFFNSVESFISLFSLSFLLAVC